MNLAYTPEAETTAQGENLAVHAKHNSGMCLSRVLGDMTNCSVGHITVNVNPVICMKKTGKEIEEEFDTLVNPLGARRKITEVAWPATRVTRYAYNNKRRVYDSLVNHQGPKRRLFLSRDIRYCPGQCYNQSDRCR